MKRLSREQIEARMEAWEQAIGSLDSPSWTDDPVEREQGDLLVKYLRKQADNWYRHTEYARGLERVAMHKAAGIQFFKRGG